MTMDDSRAVLERASDMARAGEPFALATVVWRQGPSSSQQGSRAIITASGELDGWIGGACAEPAVIREAQQVISSGSARLLLLGSPDQFGGAVPDGMRVVPIACQSEGALEVYIEPVLPVPHLVIVGRSPMAHALATMARSLDWNVDMIDGDDFVTASASSRSMLVVATQGHSDEAVLERAVAAQPAYLGVVGSRRRGEALLGYLADRGVPKKQLERVRVPAGLDLGSTTHVEIAVAILAELVRFRASGALASATAERGQGARSPHGRRSTGHTASPPKTKRHPQATDPVCGMTVTAGPNGLPLEHDGSTYYFCGSGCRQAFENDPAAYASANAKRDTRC